MEDAEASFNTCIDVIEFEFRFAKSSYRVVGTASITYSVLFVAPIFFRLYTPRIMTVGGVPPLLPVGDPSAWIYNPGT